MSRRYNALVARETCALIGRDIGVPALIRLAKHARDDGTTMSDNVIGDVVEALIGALIIDGGLDPADVSINLVGSSGGPHLGPGCVGAAVLYRA